MMTGSSASLNSSNSSLGLASNDKRPRRRGNGRPPSPTALFNGLVDSSQQQAPKPLMKLEPKKSKAKLGSLFTRSPAHSPSPSTGSPSSSNLSLEQGVSFPGTLPQYPPMGDANVNFARSRNASVPTPRPSNSSDSVYSEPRVFGGIDALKRRNQTGPAPLQVGYDGADAYHHIHITAPPTPPLSAAVVLPPSCPSSPDSSPSPEPSGRRSPWLGMLDKPTAIINKTLPRPPSPAAVAPSPRPSTPMLLPAPIMSRSRFATKQKSFDATHLRRPREEIIRPHTVYDEVMDIRAPSPVSTSSQTSSSRDSLVLFSSSSVDDSSEGDSLRSTPPTFTHSSPSPVSSRRSASPLPDATPKRKTPFPRIDIDYHVRTATRKPRNRAYSDPDTPISPGTETVLSPIRFNSSPSTLVPRAGENSSPKSPASMWGWPSSSTEERHRAAESSKLQVQATVRPRLSVESTAPLHQNPFDTDWDFSTVSPIQPTARPTHHQLRPTRSVSPLQPIEPPSLTLSRSRTPSPTRLTPLAPPPLQSVRDSNVGLLGVHKNERRQGWSGEWNNAKDMQDVIGKLRKLR